MSTPFESRLEPFTVDDLFDLPAWPLRAEAVDGCLIMSPPSTPRHQRAGDRLCSLLNDALPSTVEALTAVPIRLPGGAGPIADLVVTTVVDDTAERGLPVAEVHTVVEVVSAGSSRHDRLGKRDLYAAAGITCYWRVELDSWSGYRGPLPVIVVRIRRDARWCDIVAPPGREHDLPVVVGRPYPVIGRPYALAVPRVATVRLDPAALTARRAARG